MSRRHVVFACEDGELIGTLDDAPGTTGLLIVSGGNELRAGAWNGQAILAARIAAAGHPVFRFDRRGVGDSSGENRGFRHASHDTAAALSSFQRNAPQVTKIIGFGNCDAASALMLNAGEGLNGLILSNPWTIEDDAVSDPVALRAHYASRLKDPAALLRFITGRVSPSKLLKSLIESLKPKPPPTTLAQDMARGLSHFPGPVRIVLAERDRTAQSFLGSWDKTDPRVARCPGASHSWVEPDAQEWLFNQILAALSC